MRTTVTPVNRVPATVKVSGSPVGGSSRSVNTTDPDKP